MQNDFAHLPEQENHLDIVASCLNILQNILKLTIEINDLPRKVAAGVAKLLSTFAEKLFKDLATVTIAPILVVYTTLTFTVQTFV
jgi:hypothetical protein